MPPEELWEPPSAAVGELIRALAGRMQAAAPSIVDELWSASQRGALDHAVAEDPVLAELDRRINHANFTRWVVANIDRPGRRVPPVDSPETLKYARDLVLRGLGADDLGSWRAAQRVSWNWWLDACFAATSDQRQLRELVEISANSMTTFVDDSIAALAAHVDEAQSELALGPHVQRLSTVQLLLQGAPIARDRAEAQLGYALTGHHLAGIVWVDAEDSIQGLELAAERVMRACGVERRLTLVAGIATLWIWMPVNRVPDRTELEEAIATIPGVRLVLGRSGSDVSGFRRSHLDAIASQRLLARLGSLQRVTRYPDVQLISLLTADLAEADHFVADTLGELATADPVLQKTVRVFVAEQFNSSKTADKLFAHRNTIDRRLARADELLPCPLAQNPTAVDAALALLELRASR
ncbi:PucR family transcriptional regulator [Nocardia asteroides]|uniref:PucR family transcriptional regulator n=1 Tax=Nocardia asteroides TaxID=1824 RepID=UPI0037CA8B2E